MDHGQTSAERLPELYRAILDAVGELERRGNRRDAARIRRAATRAYRVWDIRAEQRLARMRADIDRLIAGSDRRPERRWSIRPGTRGPHGCSSPPSPTA
jgi:hypothetical protein